MFDSVSRCNFFMVILANTIVNCINELCISVSILPDC